MTPRQISEIMVFILVILSVNIIILKKMSDFTRMFMTDKVINELYILISKVHDILKEHNIPYFIVFGTLLGSVRSGEFIPWDNDVDIGIMIDDIDKFHQIDFAKYNLKTEGIEPNNIGKIFYIDKFNSNQKMKGLFVDVFFFQKDADKIIYTSEYAKKKWSNGFFYKNELFPLKNDYKFGSLYLNGPSKCIDYFKRLYGNNWKKPRIDKYYRMYLINKHRIVIYITIFLFVNITLLYIMSKYRTLE